MGFWRGVGYFISIIIIIIGIAFFPVGIIGIILGAIFIWMLKRGASQERVEKQLKELNERDKARSLREIADREGDMDTHDEKKKNKRKISKYLIPPIVIIMVVVVISILKQQ
jgi:Flp pilus assembly protein TadB